MASLKHNGVEVKVESILDTVVFPISRQNLIEFAQEMSDGDDVIDIFGALQNRMHEKREEVDKEVRQILKQKKKKEKKRHRG